MPKLEVTLKIEMPQLRSRKVADLLAEEVGNQDLEEQLRLVTADRDDAKIWADRLAGAVASEEEIGTFTDGNNPWANALVLLEKRLGVDPPTAPCCDLCGHTAVHDEDCAFFGPVGNGESAKPAAVDLTPEHRHWKVSHHAGMCGIWDGERCNCAVSQIANTKDVLRRSMEILEGRRIEEREIRRHLVPIFADFEIYSTEAHSLGFLLQDLAPRIGERLAQIREDGRIEGYRSALNDKTNGELAAIMAPELEAATLAERERIITLLSNEYQFTVYRDLEFSVDDELLDEGGIRRALAPKEASNGLA